MNIMSQTILLLTLAGHSTINAYNQSLVAGQREIFQSVNALFDEIEKDTSRQDNQEIHVFGGVNAPQITVSSKEKLKLRKKNIRTVQGLLNADNKNLQATRALLENAQLATDILHGQDQRYSASTRQLKEVVEKNKDLPEELFQELIAEQHCESSALIKKTSKLVNLAKKKSCNQEVASVIKLVNDCQSTIRDLRAQLKEFAGGDNIEQLQRVGSSLATLLDANSLTESATWEDLSSEKDFAQEFAEIKEDLSKHIYNINYLRNPIPFDTYQELVDELCTIGNGVIGFCDTVIEASSEQGLNIHELEEYKKRVGNAIAKASQEKGRSEIYSALKHKLLGIRHTTDSTIYATKIVIEAAKNVGIETEEVQRHFDDAIKLHDSFGARIVILLFDRSIKLITDTLMTEELCLPQREKLTKDLKTLQAEREGLEGLNSNKDYETMKAKLELLREVTGGNNDQLNKVAEESRNFYFHSYCNPIKQ